MKQPNPMISSGMNPDTQRRGRARMRLAVVGIVLAHVVLFTGILFNACKQDDEEKKPQTSQLPELPQLKPEPGPLGPTSEVPTGPIAPVGPVAPPTTTSDGPLVPIGPFVPTGPVATGPTPPPAPAAMEHVIASGDSFYKLARKYGVGFKTIEAANPGVVPTKLQIGQKIVIPPPKEQVATASPAGEPNGQASAANEIIIERGDSLSVLARRHGTTVKELQQANNLAGTRIFAGQKLKLPAGARLPSTPAPNPASAPVASPTTILVPGTGPDLVAPPPPVTTTPAIPTGN